MQISGLRLRIVFAIGLLLPAALLAHPMGNFSVNHYSRIVIGRDVVQLRYLIDMAEIPTFQELQAAGLNADEKDSRVPAYLSTKANEFSRGIVLRLDGRAVEFACTERQVIFPPGAGGLPTMKFGFTCRAPVGRLSSGPHEIDYRDDNFRDRAGWKEVIIDADSGMQLVSTAARQDRSRELSNYPTDLLHSPPQDVSAKAEFSVFTRSPEARGNGLKSVQGQMPATEPAKIVPLSETRTSADQPARVAPNAQPTPRNAFTQLIATGHLSLWFLLTAGLIAMSLGALHALEPGHGKTLVAAYLVGSRGAARHAVSLGIIVTLAHTAGVYVLGAITLYASRYVLPEKLYPWLGIVSGLIIFVLGVLLFLRRWMGESSAGTVHRHWYGDSDHAISGAQASTAGGGPVSTRQLLLLGITGGLVPCPAALVVLLSAVALHRIAFGFFLIVAFSVGLAAVLVGIGLVMVRAGRLLTHTRLRAEFVERRLPLFSALFVAIIGAALTLQSLKGAGVSLSAGSFASPKWLLVAGIGLLLGMRHSTDPDHVIAVTTIVTRLRTLRHASLVGMLWGLGHTLTIFIVGSAIILFGIAIPPRIGLSMEFAVAVMLILLGVLNLTGVLAWITDRFTPSRSLKEAQPEFEMDGSSESALSRTVSRFGAYQLVRPLAIGIVHGLAGSAAVALLVLATIHNPIWAIGYLLLFGLGTIAGMMLMTAVIAMPVVWTGKNFIRLNRYMCATSGIVSVAFGLFLVYQIGFVSGLFSAAPRWIPE